VVESSSGPPAAAPGSESASSGAGSEGAAGTGSKGAAGTGSGGGFGSAEGVGPFDDFYRAQSDRVFRALAVTLGDSHLAREATDEAMARACARWRRVAGLHDPGGWAYRVGFNWATSWWRKVRREQAMPDELGPADVAARGANGTAVASVDPDATAALAALGGLTTAHRTVVVCRVLLQLSTAETATVLGISEGTVSRLARALATKRGQAMRRIVDDIAVPEDLANAVRGAAGAVPGRASDLEEVHRRLVARRRRLAGGTAALAALLVAVAVVVPFAVTRDVRPLPGPAGGSGPSASRIEASASAPAARSTKQRLFLRIEGFVSVPPGVSGAPDQPDPAKPNLGYPPGAWGLLSIGGIKEVLADGRVITHSLSGAAQTINDVVSLPDGRLVTLGFTDLAPKLHRTFWPCVEHLAEPLAIHARGGEAVTSRDLRIRCHFNALVGATAAEAYLVRDDRLLAHRFSNGAERDIVNVSQLGDRVNDLNLAAGRAAAAYVPDDGTCVLRVLDLRTGELGGAIPMDPPRVDCNAKSVRLSPDGRLVAMSYNVLEDGEVWLAVFEIATGRIRLRKLVDQRTASREMVDGFAGAAWTDSSTLRVAWTRIRNQDRVNQIEDVLDVRTYRVS